MKKFILFIASSLLMSIYATADEPTSITFGNPTPPQTGNTQTGNHAPARRIFSGYYDSVAGAVAIFFLEDMGQVTITVDGAEGPVAVEVADTLFGETVIPVPALAAGTYIVTITIASGGVYSGYFTI